MTSGVGGGAWQDVITMLMRTSRLKNMSLFGRVNMLPPSDILIGH